jgi:hypothetical protein
MEESYLGVGGSATIAVQNKLGNDWFGNSCAEQALGMIRSQPLYWRHYVIHIACMSFCHRCNMNE